MYVPSKHAINDEAAWEIVRDLPEAWRDGTPMFARPLARGLAVAESPSGEAGAPLESFGQHRCSLVAAGVLARMVAGDHDPLAWRVAVDAAFAAAGISPATPHVQSLPAELLS